MLELLTQLFDASDKVGVNITSDKARVDFLWEGNIETAFPQVEAVLNRLIEADPPISSDFSDRAAQCRFWRTDGFATVPCGGTGPASTGEVGAVSLKRVNPDSGKERIEIRLMG